MKIITRLNGFAFLYGIILLIQTELMVNLYRLERIIPFYNRLINNLLILLIFILSTAVFFLLTVKYLNHGIIRYLVTILWIPYYILFVLLFTHILPPITDPMEEPSNALGLVLIFLYLCYPIYIAFITFISRKKRFPQGRR